MARELLVRFRESGNPEAKAAVDLARRPYLAPQHRLPLAAEWRLGRLKGAGKT